MSARHILHVDMDAFYASVEVRDRPELAGRPVIVGGTPQGRGVVAAASYAAREFGVHSAMPTSRALRLCPDAIILRPRMDYYAEISAQIRDIFERFTPDIEPLSLDEAFLDVTGCRSLFGPAIEIARLIKRTILEELHLVASVGIAPNKFLAKLASDLDKPDGFVVVDPNAVEAFLDPLPVRRLWGVGRVMEQSLAERNIQTIGDIRAQPRETMESHFGKAGTHLWLLSQGIDEREVISDRRAKSISHETTFPEDIADPELLAAWAQELTEQVGRRLRRHQLRGRTIQLKVRFSNFETITRSETLAQATNSTQEVWSSVREMLSSRLPRGHQPVRLIGVGVSGFDQSQQQLTLFDDEAEETPAELDQTTDAIRQKFGASSIGRGSVLLRGINHTAAPSPHDPGSET